MSSTGSALLSAVSFPVQPSVVVVSAISNSVSVSESEYGIVLSESEILIILIDE